MKFQMMANQIKFDWAIKRLLRQKANFAILEGLVSVVLQEDILIEQILESECLWEIPEDKFYRVNILALNSRQERIFIELQNERIQDYYQRMLYGVSKTTAEHLNLGEKYEAIKKVYSINIVYFDLGNGEDYVYRGKTEFEGLHRRDKLSLSEKQKEYFHKKNVYEIFPEYYVLKVNKFDDVAKDSLDEWIYYLKNSKVKDEFKAKGLAEVKEKLRVDDLSEGEGTAYYRHIENNRVAISVIDTAIWEGKQKGKEEGKMEHAIEVAKALKANGVSTEIISKSTGLSEEEINSLLV
jgi:predicted transposase/invertase (TIGR01784 family)